MSSDGNMPPTPSAAVVEHLRSEFDLPADCNTLGKIVRGVRVKLAEQRNWLVTLEQCGATKELLAAPSAKEILQVCIGLAAFLMRKNLAYGDSALKPLRIMSKADPVEQIRVRMDDKLSRLFRGQASGEDPLHDLVGYWVLEQVAKRIIEMEREHAGG